MAIDKKSFVLYSDLIKVVSKLPNDKAGELFKIILEYVNDLNPNINDLLLEIAFEPIKLQLKRDLKVWYETRSKRSDIGRLGGIASGIKRSKMKQNEPLLNSVEPNEANEAVNVTVNVTDTVTVNDTVNDINTINYSILDNAEINSADIKQEVTFTEKPKEIIKEKKYSAEKKESPFYEECKNIFLEFYESNNQKYIWKPIDNKALGGLIQQIKITLNKTNGINPSSQEIKDLIKILLNKLPEWYKNNANSVAVINSKYNDIINQIKNDRKKQPISSSASDIMSKYYRKE